MVAMTTQQRVVAITLLTQVYVLILIYLNYSRDEGGLNVATANAEKMLSKVDSGGNILNTTVRSARKQHTIEHIGKKLSSDGDVGDRNGNSSLLDVINSEKTHSDTIGVGVEDSEGASRSTNNTLERTATYKEEQIKNNVRQRKLLAHHSGNLRLHKTLHEKVSGVSQHRIPEAGNASDPEALNAAGFSLPGSSQDAKVLRNGNEEADEDFVPGQKAANVSIPRRQKATHAPIPGHEEEAQPSHPRQQAAAQSSTSKLQEASQAVIPRRQEVAEASLIEYIKEAKDSRSEELKDKDNLLLDITVNITGVTISVDGHQVYSSLNKTALWGGTPGRLHAGLHLLALHQLTGQAMATAAYMTWLSTTDRQFTENLQKIQDGRLLVILGAPDFTLFLEEATIRVLKEMGALYIDRLAYKDAWCLLVHKGGGVLQEALVTSLPQRNLSKFDVSPLTLHVSVPRKTQRTCGWYGSQGMEERAVFCQTYEGYDNFCSCDDPPWSPQPHSPVEYEMKEVIPVAIVTARRLPHVLRQVGQVWASPGGTNTPITIFVDGHNPEAQALAALLQLPLVQHHNPVTRGQFVHDFHHPVVY